MCAPLRGIWCLYEIFGMEMQGWIIHCVCQQWSCARREDTREKAEKNNRICQGESALMSPYDLLHSYAQQNNPQLKASTLTLVFLDKYISWSGQLHLIIWTNTFDNLDKYFLQFLQIRLAIWTNTLCYLLHLYAQQPSTEGIHSNFGLSHSNTSAIILAILIHLATTGFV